MVQSPIKISEEHSKNSGLFKVEGNFVSLAKSLLDSLMQSASKQLLSI